MIFFTGSQAVGRPVARDARRAARPGRAGARRQVGDDRAGRRRPAARRARRRVERVRAQRPGLHPHRARLRRGAGRRALRRAVRPRRSRSCARARPAAARRPTTSTSTSARSRSRRSSTARARRSPTPSRKGARVVDGRRARAPTGAGRFFAPTMLADATPEMAVMREETFGPVLPVMRVRERRGRRCASPTIRRSACRAASGRATRRGRGRSRGGSRSGSVCVNDVLVNYFCVEAPLGGVKASGLGLPPRPRGAAPVLPHRDRRRGPPAARMALALHRPAADVPVPGAHAAPAAPLHALFY